MRIPLHQIAALVLLIIPLQSPAFPDSTADSPQFLSITQTGSVIVLQWEADPAYTQWVDRAVALSTNAIEWTPVFTNIPPGSATNSWVDEAAAALPGSFYRIRTEGTTSPKIGQTATFITRFHNVSGTATILDSETIRVTDFNYDATGLLVYMIISPNSNFAPYTAISGDLIRDTPYVNETLDFSIPPETNLDDIQYISVWCVDINRSFGDGSFQ